MARAFALALAALTLTTHVAVAVHGAVAQHTFCEHGQLVDVEQGGVSKQDAWAEAPVAGPTLRALDAAPGHDHCALAAAPHGGTAFNVAPAAATPLIPGRPASPSAATPLDQAIPLWALAPKGSPPRRPTLRG